MRARTAGTRAVSGCADDDGVTSLPQPVAATIRPITSTDRAACIHFPLRKNIKDMTTPRIHQPLAVPFPPMLQPWLPPPPLDVVVLRVVPHDEIEPRPLQTQLGEQKPCEQQPDWQSLPREHESAQPQVSPPHDAMVAAWSPVHDTPEPPPELVEQ